jgi:hypothetical protein
VRRRKEMAGRGSNVHVIAGASASLLSLPLSLSLSLSLFFPLLSLLTVAGAGARARAWGIKFSRKLRSFKKWGIRRATVAGWLAGSLHTVNCRFPFPPALVASELSGFTSLRDCVVGAVGLSETEAAKQRRHLCPSYA